MVEGIEYGREHETDRILTMHPEIEELANCLNAAVNLLRSVGEAKWSNWLSTDEQRIRQLDFYGIEHLLSAFGGMGSINDLVLHPINGHKIEISEISATNERFQELKGQFYDLAWKLKHEEP